MSKVFTDNYLHMEMVLGKRWDIHFERTKNPLVCSQCEAKRIVVHGGNSFYCPKCRWISWLKPDTYSTMVLSRIAPLHTNWNTVGGMAIMWVGVFTVFVLYATWEAVLMPIHEKIEKFLGLSEESRFAWGLVLLVPLLALFIFVYFVWFTITSVFRIASQKILKQN